jgi:hypothetical protein
MITAPASGNAAIATGLLWMCSTLSFLFFDPARAWETQENFYSAVAADPVLYQLPRVLLALTAFVGLAAVLGIFRVLRNFDSGWLDWSSLLVVIGFALTGVSQVRFALINPERAAIYVHGDAATKLAIEASRFTLQLDPQGVIATVSLLVWLIVVNRLALTSQSWPRPACLLGFVVVIVSLMGLSARASGLAPFVPLASLVNGVVAPAWFLWVGFALRNGRKPAAA